MHKKTGTTPKVATLRTSSSPALILIRGLPGSGKSYLATALRESIGKDEVAILDPDATDYKSKAYVDLAKTFTAEGIDAKFHPYRFLRARGYDAITAGKVVIWNQGFTNLDGFNKTIINLQTFAAEHDIQLPVLVVEVAVSPNIAKKRVAMRAGQGGHDVPEDAFARFINDYVSFANEGYNIVAVNGEDDVSVSVAAVMQALEALPKK